MRCGWQPFCKWRYLAIIPPFLPMPHLNLLGFVALFLFGIFYRLNPAVEAREARRRA
jgi:hypothetical protein